MNINKIENQNKREIKKSKFFYIKNDLKKTKDRPNLRLDKKKIRFLYCWSYLSPKKYKHKIIK